MLRYTLGLHFNIRINCNQFQRPPSPARHHSPVRPLVRGLFSLSYRDLEELMQERGYAVDHSTIQRWVVYFAPRIEKAFRKNKKQTGNRWRLDETYIKIKGEWKYLYRAVDKQS